MIIDHDLKTSIAVSEKNKDYGVKMIVRQVQLSYPNLTKVSTVSKKFAATFLFPKKNLSAKMKKELEGVVKYLLANDKTFVEAELKSSALQKIGNTFLAIGKDGSFLKNGDVPNKTTRTIPEETAKAYMFHSKAGVKKEGGIDRPATNIDYRYSTGDIIPDMSINSELYGGAIVNVSLTVKGYMFGGKYGITTYLSGIQKLADSTKFGNTRTDFEADDSFEDVGNGDVPMGVKVV